MLMPAVDPRDHVFRAMLVLSGIAHVAALLASAVWMGLVRPPLRPDRVAVVNLIGGAQFHRATAPAPPAKTEAREPEPPPRSAHQAKSRHPEPARRTPSKEAPPPPPHRPASAEAMAAPDTAALEKKLSQLRADRARSKEIREAAREAGRERDYVKAISSIRERVAHRIDLPEVRPAPPGTPAGSAGTQGNVRIAPELMEYFSQLDERIRANWRYPGTAGKDAGRLMVVLRIMIERDGRVSDVRMEQKSVNPYFDDSVLRAISKASPLPVPPEGLRGGENYYEVGFRFFATGAQR